MSGLAVSMVVSTKWLLDVHSWLIVQTVRQLHQMSTIVGAVHAVLGQANVLFCAAALCFCVVPFSPLCRTASLCNSLATHFEQSNLVSWQSII